MRSPLLVLASVCVVSLLTATASMVWWRTDTPPPPWTDEDPVTTESGEEDTEELTAIATMEREEGGLDETGDALVDDEVDGDLREEVDASSTQGLAVHVVRGEPRTAAPGASVYFITQTEARRRLPDFGQLPQSTWPEKVGQRLLADAQGAVTLPPSPEPYLVSAVLEDEFAFAQLNPRRRQTTLQLHPDERVVMVVTWPDGTPAPGLPVALAHKGARGEAEQLCRLDTDARGRAVVPHFQLLRPPPVGNKPADQNASELFVALLCLPTAEPVATPFEGRPAQREVVSLVAPWLGKVDVVLTDQRGTPLLSPAQVWLTAGPSAPRGNNHPAAVPNPAATAVPRSETMMRADKAAGAAPVTFTNAPTEVTMQVSVRFPFVRRGPRMQVTGPQRAGEAQTAELRLQDDKAVLAGRLRFDDDTSAGPVTAQVIAWRGDRAIGEMRAEAINDGRFDMVLEPRDSSPQDWLEFRCTRQTPEGTRVHGKRVPLPSLLSGERRDLGDIVLAPLPPLATGRVVDDLGVPIADASLQLQSLHTENGRERWRNVPGSGVRSAADGTFELLGERPPGQLQLYADSGQHFGSNAPLLPHPRATHIVLARNGVLAGRVLLPNWVNDGMLELSVRPNDPSLDERTKNRQSQRVALGRARGGRFTLQPLRAGMYDVVVRMRNLPDPVFELAALYVNPGLNRDSRLAMIDLRLAIFRYRLQATDTAGQRMSVDTPLLARFMRPDGSAGSAGFRFSKGRAEVVTTQSMLEFVAFASGCAPTVVTLAAGDHTIMLQQLRPALLHLPSARALCGPTRRVRVSTILTGATGYPESLSGLDQRSGQQFSFPRWEMGKSSGAWLESSDTVEVPLALSGEYEVVLRVHATDSPRSAQASVSLGNHTLRVDGMNETVRIPLDAEKVLEALRQVDARQAAAIEQARQRELQQQQQQQPNRRGR